jgi:uncharacterized protein (UPF0261 family)
MRRIFVVGTADTKGEELAYLRSVIAEAGALPVVVDVGIVAMSIFRGPRSLPTIRRV